MKKKIIILSVVAVALLTAAYLLFFRAKAQEVTVETTQVKTGTISNVITATGTIEPTNQVEVGTQVSGVIQKIYVDYNSKVKKGQLIAELDKTALKSIVTKAQASLTSAQNELQYQKTNYNRATQLYEAKVSSRSDYEEALYKFNSAKATVAQQTSELKQAQTNLSYANIYSPVDGVILSKDVDEGQTVAASYSTPTLFTIARDLTKMQVEADVDEADIGQVKEGQRVMFTVDAYPNDSFTGSVVQIRKNAQEESNVVTYQVIIEAGNPDGKLMPGLTASTSIVTEEVKDVLTIEAGALRFEPTAEVLQAYYKKVGLEAKNKPNLAQASAESNTPVQLVSQNSGETKTGKKQMVYVKAGNAIEAREVTTGLSNGTTVEITKGLSAGDEVVTAMEIVSQDAASGNGSAGQSPFMPTPPGRKK
ncbi:MAG: efflux transporter periplasmic adaptor subunit [Cytophagales bacterium CG18_big_fil_WC_8_21_14_2_50_42_9]|nr:MAG: efflux transporter periplasmic adaptor subunit [Cytophagales bacterium CG18_big_fil_WC_8_21_14_2_50_42_9]